MSFNPAEAEEWFRRCTNVKCFFYIFTEGVKKNGNVLTIAV